MRAWESRKRLGSYRRTRGTSTYNVGTDDTDPLGREREQLLLQGVALDVDGFDVLQLVKLPLGILYSDTISLCSSLCR